MNVRNKLSRGIYGGLSTAMSKRYWVAVTTFGIALLILATMYVWSEYQIAREDYRRYQEGSEASQREAAWQIAEKCSFIFPEVASFGECLWNEIKSYQNQDSTNKDLQAQQDMAIWSKWTFIVSAVNIAFSVIGLAALIYSLFLNRMATNAAVAAVGAERAWITYRGLAIGPARDIKIDGVQIPDGVGVFMEWQNTGRSPAVKVICGVQYRLLGSDEALPRFDMDAEMKAAAEESFIGPTTTISVNPKFITIDEAMSIREGRAKLIAYSKVMYFDVFSTEIRHTELCGEIKIHGEIVRNGARSINAEFLTAGPQNTIS